MPASYRKILHAIERCTPLRLRVKNLHAMLPPRGGVYVVSQLVRGDRRVMYVGKAGSIRGRLYTNLLNGQLRSHTLSRKCLKLLGLTEKSEVKAFYQKSCAVQWIEILEAKERSFAEHYLIAHYRPPLND